MLLGKISDEPYMHEPCPHCGKLLDKLVRPAEFGLGTPAICWECEGILVMMEDGQLVGVDDAMIVKVFDTPLFLELVTATQQIWKIKAGQKIDPS